jgi:hypothetical protein
VGTDQNRVLGLVTEVRPSAVLTSLEVGTLYKRLDKPMFGEPRVVLGKVTSILADGEDAVVFAVEFFPSPYHGLFDTKITTVTSKDVDPPVLYEADKDEFTREVGRAIERQKATIEVTTRDLEQQREVLAALVNSL